MTFEKIATILQRNMELEARSVADYNDLIISIKEVEAEDQEQEVKQNLEETKQNLIDAIKELIGDELNHEIVLQQAYVFLSGIEPKED